MKIIYKLHLKIKNQSNTIFFGIPDDENDLQKMFLLRERVYNKNKYINNERFGLSDKDEYDNEKRDKCVYFIAKIGEDIIGTVRLILDDPLPTQKDFNFQEPEEIEKLKSFEKGELSRLISVPYKENVFLPRHLVLLFLISSILSYSNEKGIRGGYSFVTTKLYDKIKRIKFPFHVIDIYEQKYPKDGLMYPYFSKKDNPIIPIYYKLDEAIKYFDNLMRNRRMFTKKGNGEFLFNDGLYNKFLMLLKII